MNILDEQVIESQRQLLRSWRIPMRQIGQDIGRKGMKDQQIIPFLLQLHHPTFVNSSLFELVNKKTKSPDIRLKGYPGFL